MYMSPAMRMMAAALAAPSGYVGVPRNRTITILPEETPAAFMRRLGVGDSTLLRILNANGIEVGLYSGSTLKDPDGVPVGVSGLMGEPGCDPTVIVFRPWVAGTVINYTDAMITGGAGTASVGAPFGGGARPFQGYAMPGPRLVISGVQIGSSNGTGDRADGFRLGVEDVRRARLGAIVFVAPWITTAGPEYAEGYRLGVSASGGVLFTQPDGRWRVAPRDTSPNPGGVSFGRGAPGGYRGP